MHHLPEEAAGLIKTYQRHTSLHVEWVRADSQLAPGTLLLCPPRAFVEILPDGSCTVAPCKGALDKPMDRFLDSLARSYGERAIGIVLSGMSEDGAAGARQLALA